MPLGGFLDLPCSRVYAGFVVSMELGSVRYLGCFRYFCSGGFRVFRLV